MTTRKRWQAIIDFVADSDDDAADVFIALSAQVYDADGVTEVECEWIEGDPIAPAGESAGVSLALLPVLHDVGWLASAAFRLAAGGRTRRSYGDVAWLDLDWEADLARSNLGTMRLSDLRRYYSGTTHPDGTPRLGAVG